MKSWSRITLVIFGLVGGATSFGYWSINQFNQTFDNLSHSLSIPYLASTRYIRLASTSPEILGGLATSISGGQATSTDGTIPVITSTTTPSFGLRGASTTPVTATSSKSLKKTN